MGAVLEEEEEEEGEKSFHICDYSGIGIVRYQVTVNFSVRKRKKKKKEKRFLGLYRPKKISISAPEMPTGLKSARCMALGLRMLFTFL